MAAFAKLVGDGHGFLLESVEHGERWSRFSFVGWDPVLTMTLRDGVVAVEGSEHVDVPRDRGILAALEALLAAYRAPELPELPPLSGGLIGYLGYDVVREIERLPDVPPSDQPLPGRGDEHDRIARRVRPLAAAGDADRERAGPRRRRRRPRRRLRRRRRPRIGAAVAALGRPLPYVPVPPPAGDDDPPAVVSSMPGGAYQRAVAVAKEHIVAGDIFQVVLAQRFDLDLDADPFDVYRVLRQINPSPYMYFVRGPEVTVVGSSPEPMVQGRRRRGDLAPDRRHAQARPHRRARPPPRRRARSSTPRSGPST